MKNKRKLLNISSEDFRDLMKLKTDERTYVDVIRKAIKDGLFLQWVEIHEPEIYYKLVQKYKEFLNSQNNQQTSSKIKRVKYNG
jgi:thiaminase